MKKIIIFACFAILATSLFAQWTNKEISATREKHLALLSEVSTPMRDARFEMRLINNKTYSLLMQEKEASVYTSYKDCNYLLCATREAQENGWKVDFTLHIKAENYKVTASGSIKKSLQNIQIDISPDAIAAGYTSITFLPLATSLVQNTNCCGNWAESLVTDPEVLETYYATRDEAVAHVPTHVSPKYCFVWRDGSSSTPWRPIPGTGCAHWVAHQKGIRSSPGCYDGYAIRVSQVVSGKTRYSISQARVGDIWTNTDLSHCGIVIGVGSGYAQVRHCSSGSGGVVVSNFTSGYAYR